MSCFVSGSFFGEKLSRPGSLACGGKLCWSDRSRGGRATGPLNMTCSMDTTSVFLFSLCNWADNVPWFPLFCTSICSAWAVQCILASWKWSGVSKRSGPPPTPPLLQLCRWARGIATAGRQEFTERPVLRPLLTFAFQNKSPAVAVENRSLKETCTNLNKGKLPGSGTVKPDPTLACQPPNCPGTFTWF